MRPPLLQPRTFRTRIVAAALFTSCAALIVAGSLFFARQWSSDRQQLMADRTIQARMMAANLAAPLLFADAQAARDTLSSSRNVPDLRSVRLFDNAGRVLAEVNATTVHRPPAFTGARTSSSRFTAGALEIRVPVELHGQQLGELVMSLGLQQLERRLGEHLLFALLLLGGVAGLAGFLAHALSRRVVEPVTQLSKAIRQVRDSSDFTLVVEAKSQDELGQLTQDFNELLRVLQHNAAELSTAMHELVEARDTAEAANSAKSQFLANMSHEIRTPLNAVLGMVQVMARDPLDEVQRQRLEVIRSSGKGLLALLGDMLDLSKIEAERLELDINDFDLAAALRSACDPFCALADARGVLLRLDINEVTHGLWRGDPVRVRQIISNLVSNAVKFTLEGEIRVQLSLAGAGARIEVRDTGVGIAEDALPLLFDKFAQADASVTRRFGGTGLGLAISRQLAQLMGGDITVSSEPGAGSTFTVYLPLSQVRRCEAAPESSAEDSGIYVAQERPLRILAAEDNPTNQLVLRAMMEAFEADLTIVSDGAAAVEAYGRHRFDLILMDVQMPVMDGVSATAEIRRLESEEGGERTPIIALTANVMKHQIAAYLQAGMSAYVAKPIEAELLYQAIHDALSAPTCGADEVRRHAV